jgi:hypothetical protein
MPRESKTNGNDFSPICHENALIEEKFFMLLLKGLCTIMFGDRDRVKTRLGFGELLVSCVRHWISRYILWM